MLPPELAVLPEGDELDQHLAITKLEQSYAGALAVTQALGDYKQGVGYANVVARHMGLPPLDWEGQDTTTAIENLLQGACRLFKVFRLPGPTTLTTHQGRQDT